MPFVSLSGPLESLNNNPDYIIRVILAQLGKVTYFKQKASVTNWGHGV